MSRIVSISGNFLKYQYVEVVAIDERDAAFDDRKEFIGRVGQLRGGAYIREDGWYDCLIKFDQRFLRQFKYVKLAHVGLEVEASVVVEGEIQ